MGAVWALLAGTFSEFVKSRSEIAEKKAVARAKAVNEGIPGWSDEWLVFCISYPFIACFIPGLAESAQAGLDRFAAFPEWYQGLFGTVVVAVFGLDKVLKWRAK